MPPQEHFIGQARLFSVTRETTNENITIQHTLKILYQFMFMQIKV
jgi:hypothetical protein